MKKADINQSSFSLKNKLTESNWYVYFQELSDFLNAFGKAGVEIRDDPQASFTEPLRTENVNYQVLKDDGSITNTNRPWNNKDEPIFNSKYDKYIREVEKYEKDKSNLWIFIISNMDNQVLLRLKTQQNEYDSIQKNNDTLGLFRLMKSKLLEATNNRASLLRKKWHELKQYNEITGEVVSLMEYLVQFESHLKMLKGTTSEPSKEDKVFTLSNGLIQRRYASYLERMSTENIAPDLQEMKDALVRLDNTLPNIYEDFNNKKDYKKQYADNQAMSATNSSQKIVTFNTNKLNNNQNYNKNNNGKKPYNIIVKKIITSPIIKTVIKF